MHCQHILFPIFLFIYILTGIIFAVVTYLLYHNRSDYDNKYESHLNPFGRYYIGLIALFILLSCLIQLITIICCKRKLILFRIIIVLLILGIILELTTLTIIVFMRSGIHPDIRKTTMIVLSSLTAYLIILQIYGVVASLSYYSELQHSYRQVPVK